LLDAGANPFIRNNAGQTPLDFVRNYKLSSPKIHIMLEEAEKNYTKRGSHE
jgi:hypothetical protein